jgi:AcrR family transcriptional regulator
MSERKQQILQTAIEIIVSQGYGSLSMRALARASGIKLGALQYHFRTWEDMLRALVAYINEQYKRNFESIKASQSLSIKAVINLAVSEPAGANFSVDKLWPQLWAMGQVHPLVADLVDEIYAEYIQILEDLLVKRGSTAPHAEALCLLSLVEGSTLFIGSGRRWEEDSPAVLEKIYAFVDSVYGDDA